MNKCEICNKEILNDSQFINGKWYHNKCIKNCKIVLDKIKEEVEYWGYDRNTNDDSAFRMAMKKIHHLLEEIK